MKKVFLKSALILMSAWSLQAQAADKVKVGILLPLTGTFAAVADTQKEGALLAIDDVNKRGGLNMPGGKVEVEGIVEDDEAKQDVGVRRYRYMRDAGDKGLYAVDPLPFPPLIIGGTGICSTIFIGDVVCPCAGEF